MAPHFEEKSGIVRCQTEWGRWYQTVAEVVIEVDLEEGTKGKEVKVDIAPSKLRAEVRGKVIFEVIQKPHAWRILINFQDTLRTCGTDCLNVPYLPTLPDIQDYSFSGFTPQHDSCGRLHLDDRGPEALADTTGQV